MERYLATYCDTHGTETTVIDNDGATLRIVLRGVEFVGKNFDSLEPIDAAPNQIRTFTLHYGALCSCRLAFRMFVPVSDGDKQWDGELSVELVLGNPTPNGRLDREDIHLILACGREQFIDSGTHGCFEDAILAIQSRLPHGFFIKACINCLYSDYSPFGNGTFGCMVCFRNLKAEYLKVTSKKEFWSVHGRQERFVQETYLCPDFERRIPGTGYRG